MFCKVKPLNFHRELTRVNSKSCWPLSTQQETSNWEHHWGYHGSFFSVFQNVSKPKCQKHEIEVPRDPKLMLKCPKTLTLCHATELLGGVLCVLRIIPWIIAGESRIPRFLPMSHWALGPLIPLSLQTLLLKLPPRLFKQKIWGSKVWVHGIYGWRTIYSPTENRKKSIKKNVKFGVVPFMNHDVHLTNE